MCLCLRLCLPLHIFRCLCLRLCLQTRCDTGVCRQACLCPRNSADEVDIEDLSEDEVLDKQKLSDYQRLDLAIEQLLLSSAMTEGFSCYMTPYGDFSKLPRAEEIDEKLDLIEVCPSDIFAALCHSPTQYSNILHYYSNFGSKIHQILSATFPGNYYQINTDPYTHAGDHQILDEQISLNTTKKVIYSNESEIHSNKDIQFDSILIDAPSLDDRFSANVNSRKNIFHPQETLNSNRLQFAWVDRMKLKKL